MQPADSNGKQTDFETPDGPRQQQLAALYGARALHTAWQKKRSLVRGNRGKVTVECGFFPLNLQSLDHITTVVGIKKKCELLAPTLPPLTVTVSIKPEFRAA